VVPPDRPGTFPPSFFPETEDRKAHPGHHLRRADRARDRRLHLREPANSAPTETTASAASVTRAGRGRRLVRERPPRASRGGPQHPAGRRSSRPTTGRMESFSFVAAARLGRSTTLMFWTDKSRIITLRPSPRSPASIAGLGRLRPRPRRNSAGKGLSGTPKTPACTSSAGPADGLRRQSAALGCTIGQAHPPASRRSRWARSSPFVCIVAGLRRPR